MGWGGQGAGSQWGDFPPCYANNSTVLQAHLFLTAPPGARMSWPGKSPGFKGKYLSFRSHHGHLKAVWPQAIYLALKHLTFSIYKIGANVLPQRALVQMTELMHAPQLAQGRARGAQQSSPPLPVSPPEPRLSGCQSGAVPTHYIRRSSSQK